MESDFFQHLSINKFVFLYCGSFVAYRLTAASCIVPVVLLLSYFRSVQGDLRRRWINSCAGVLTDRYVAGIEPLFIHTLFALFSSSLCFTFTQFSPVTTGGVPTALEQLRVQYLAQRYIYCSYWGRGKNWTFPMLSQGSVALSHVSERICPQGQTEYSANVT